VDIHFIAIGGTGMAPLACLLEELGHRVRGSDGPLYPPMSTMLADAGIVPLVGFDAAHLHPAPDLVVVGNAVPRQNAEAKAAEERSLPTASMPQAVARFLLAGRDPLVVAGTHGKTTTTAMAAWVWERAGTDPGYLIGGVPQDLPRSFRLGGGNRFIIEGDEYNAAYFDRGPKFLHYRPRTLILTSVEYDHADLYPDPEALVSAYRRLVALVPADGLLVACGDSPAVREVAASARCPVTTYGLAAENDVRAEAGWSSTAEGLLFTVEGTAVRMPISGRHNLANALGVWAASRADGLDRRLVADALGCFHGVRRRMEVRGTARGVTVVEDFAHHPTAVRETLRALAERFPGRRLLVLFEPRSLTAGRSFFFDAYREAFQAADRVFLAPIFHAGRLAEDERLDVDRLAAQLCADGTPTLLARDLDELAATVLAEAGQADVLVTMSSGSFEEMPGRLLARLAD
jgi:UDP-N-acetylmuramate: L-alanyl-gamma-D-glutamyl-meso-diaminopimelate ligase